MPERTFSPLVKFDSSERASIVSMPAKTRSQRRKRRTSRKISKGRLRVIKGRVNLKVSGYSGVQKIAPGSLIPYLPLTKLRAAAKKVLRANRVPKKTIRRRKKQRVTRRKK
jgi:hypothetical protein